MKPWIFVGAALLVCAANASAQSGTTGAFVTFGGGPPSTAVVPYSADTLTVTDHTLSDGNHIHREFHGKIYRDSHGRTRSENEVLVPAGAEPFQTIHINDPVQRLAISINTRLMTANVDHFPDPEKLGAERAPTSAANTLPAQRPKIEVKHEDLGTQDIDGVQAHGERITRTIPAGAEGNEQPIVIVHENWMSAEFGASVLTKTTDPRTGTREHRLINIQRAEPDPALFQVPADYKVKDNGQPQ